MNPYQLAQLAIIMFEVDYTAKKEKKKECKEKGYFDHCKPVTGMCSCYCGIHLKGTGECGRDCRTGMFCARVFRQRDFWGACLTAIFSKAWKWASWCFNI